MSLEQRVNDALVLAMKAKDEVQKRALRAIKSQILLMKTDGTGEAITEDREIKMLQKMVKQREESLLVYTQSGREDLAAVEREDIEVIKSFLPKQLSEAEVEEVIRGVIAEVGASTVKDMGKVMGAATAKLAGQADGKLVSGIVKRLLGA